jgi:hypothetical protein
MCTISLIMKYFHANLVIVSVLLDVTGFRRFVK